MLIPTWTAVQRAFDGKKVILAWPVAQVTRRWVERFGTLGLEPPLVLALYDGPSQPLALPSAQICVLHPGPMPIPAEEERLFENWQEEMKHLPAEVLERIDQWDPDRSAIVLVPPAAQLTSVAGRRVFGGTAALRHEIENKATVDGLFARLGIATAPFRVVRLGQAATAARGLDEGHGTVWAGDNTTTIEAGARALAWVHDAPTLRAAMTLFSGRCERVRVQPFLPGVPCSIQGMCTPDGVALTVPTEMLVMNDPKTGRFVLVGMSTAWNAPPPVEAALRTMARTVGEHLRTTHAWRGGFSVDAIAAPDGRVWPTEINARMSAGLSLLDGLLPGPSLEWMERLLREGVSIGVPAERLQAWMERPLRARRTNLVRLKCPRPPCGKRSIGLAFDPARVVDEDNADAVLEWVAEAGHGVLRLELDPLRHPPGARVGPRVQAALRLAAMQFGLEVDHWQAAGGPLSGGD